MVAYLRGTTVELERRAVILMLCGAVAMAMLFGAIVEFWQW